MNHLSTEIRHEEGVAKEIFNIKDESLSFQNTSREKTTCKEVKRKRVKFFTSILCIHEKNVEEACLLKYRDKQR